MGNVMDKIVIFGYWPLLDFTKYGFDPGERLLPDSLIDKIVDAENVPDVEGVLWVYDENDSIVPVFIIDRANDIVEHLKHWSEEEYDRFSLHFEQRGDAYVVLLIPSAKKTVERCRIAYLQRNGEFETTDNYSVIYYPLGNVNIGPTFSKVKDHIGSESMLGFIDSSHIDRNNPSATDLSNIVYVGPFEAVLDHDARASHHIDALFDLM